MDGKEDITVGILQNIIERKAMEIATRKIEREYEERQALDKKLQEEVTPYNRLWLEKIVKEAGYLLTDDDKRIDWILEKLNERKGHCPCGGMTDEFLCPCRMMREYGNCKCGLYKNAIDLNPGRSRTTARIKTTDNK